MLTSGYGYFSGQHALAVGFSGTNNSKKIVYKLTGAANTNGDLALGAGFGVMLEELSETSTEVNEKLAQSEKERKEMQEKLLEQSNKINDLYNIIKELQQELKKR